MGQHANIVRNYADALEYALGGRSKYGRNVPGLVGTQVHAPQRYGVNDSSVYVRYHATDIVTFYPNGDILLNFNGWHTNTTRHRMNGCLPAGWGVYQKNWQTYLYAPDGRETAIGDKMLIPAECIRRGEMLPFAEEQTA